MARTTAVRRTSALVLLRRLERTQAEFGGDFAKQKCVLLRALDRQSMPTAKATRRLHDSLCFLRAYPDDQQLLDLVVAMLERFDQRADLRRFQKQLADSGIAGTAIRFAFYADTARWLSRRHPGALRIVWDDFDNQDTLTYRLDLFACWAESAAIDEIDMPMQDWLQRLAGPGTSDADFLIQRCATMGRTDAEREAFYDQLDPPLELRPRPGTPSRTRALLPGRTVHFQRAPLARQRPDLRTAVTAVAIETPCSEAQGQKIIELAREALVLRHRDLDAFVHGDARDVRWFDCGDGLEFAVVGVKPERRLPLEAVYAYLTIKNGVPIGYVLASALFGSSEIAYNVFDTWRGGEAARIYGHVLAVTRQLFGTDTFTIYPYQLGGGGNQEGLASGAWWFYQKLGFRAREAQVLRVMDRELAKMKRQPGYRTPIAKLAEIAEHNVFFALGKQRDDVLGSFAIGNVGLAVTDYLARRFGIDRDGGERVCADEAAQRCGVHGWQQWEAGERLLWLRWSPLVMVLPGVDTWSAAERLALAEVVRAKGGRRESEYARQLDGHSKLRAALRRLAKTGW